MVDDFNVNLTNITIAIIDLKTFRRAFALRKVKGYMPWQLDICRVPHLQSPIVLCHSKHSTLGHHGDLRAYINREKFNHSKKSSWTKVSPGDVTTSIIYNYTNIIICCFIQIVDRVQTQNCCMPPAPVILVSNRLTPVSFMN